MPYVNVGAVSQLEADSVVEVNVDGVPYALCNVGGALHALSGVCPHRGGPLGMGEINGKRVMCPWHAWEFDCVTGENDFDPTTRVTTYPVKVEGEDILIDVP